MHHRLIALLLFIFIFPALSMGQKCKTAAKVVTNPQALLQSMNDDPEKKPGSAKEVDTRPAS